MKGFLLFVIFLIPFQFALNPSPGIDLSIIRILIPLAFLWWLISGLAQKRICISKNFITLGLILFFLSSLLSAIAAQNLAWSLRKILVFASLVPLYFLITAYFKKNDFYKISRYIVISSTTVSLIGIFQFISQFIWGSRTIFNVWTKSLAHFFLGASFSQAVIHYPSWWVNIGGKTYLRATALFPDPHMMAFFLGISLPLLIPLIFHKNRSLKHYIVYGLMALINLTALLFTFSRGGYLGLLTAGLWLLIFGFISSKKQQKIFLVLVSCLLLLMILLIPLTRTRFISSFNLKEGSVAGRLAIWQKAFDIWRSNFWLGVGIGNYSYYQNPLNSYRMPIYAHNTYLDIAVEMGIFALLFWLSIFAYAIFKLFKIARMKKSDSPLRLFALSLIASLLYFLVHSFFETPLYSPRILPLLVVVLGLASILISAPSSLNKKPLSFSSLNG